MKIIKTILFTMLCLLVAPSSVSAQCPGYQANFSYTYDSVGTTISFTSTGSAGAQFWEFGNGDSILSNNPSYTYTANGWYLVCLSTFDTINGCTSSYCDSIYIQGVFGNPCNVAATMFDSVHGNSNTVDFYAYATGGSPAYTYSWSFGDGNTASNTSGNTTHVYSAAGIYAVDLLVTDSQGCTDSTSTSVIITNNTPCIVAATMSDSVHGNGNTVDFYAYATGGSSPYMYFWNFGDGNTASNTTGFVTHTYAQIGAYNVNLVVTDSMGCVDSTSYTTTTFGTTAPCAVAATMFDSVHGNSNTVDFYAYATGGSPSYNYSWSFGDGNTASNMTGFVTHTYAQAGTYYIGLVVTDSFGCVDSTSYATTTFGNSCANYYANFSYTINGNAVTFTSTGTSSNSYYWDFGDGTSGYSNNATTTHQYNGSNNLFNVCLTTQDTLTTNCMDTYCDSLYINTVPTNCNQNEVILLIDFDRYSNETSWNITDTNGVIVESGSNYTNGDTDSLVLNLCLPNGCFDLNFFDSWGDGMCCVYGQGGYQLLDSNYNVIVSSTGGFTTTETTNFCVGGATPNPCSNFNVSFNYTTNPNGSTQFAPQINGGTAGYTYFWMINNTTSFTSNPSYNYNGNGVYAVNLAVTDANGCSATYLDSILVTNNNNNPCTNVGISLDIMQDSTNPYLLWMQPIITNAPIGSQYQFSWSFGDGTGVMNGNPAHQYNNIGTYVVCAVGVDTLNGCALTICDTVTIDSSGNFSRFAGNKQRMFVNTLPPSITYITSTTLLDNQTKVVLYPNPANSQINLAIESDRAEDIQLTVVNVQGQTIVQQQQTISNGQTTIGVSVHDLPAGAYFVRLTGAATQQTIPFIKQ